MPRAWEFRKLGVLAFTLLYLPFQSIIKILGERESPMPVKSDTRFQEPENRDSAIWRFMELWKFLSLLVESHLYFVSCDRLGDPFEGSFLPAEILRSGITDEVRRGITDKLRSFRPGAKVSCWYLSEWESAALWGVYASRKEVAVQSTFNALKESLEGANHVIRIGLIRYMDEAQEVFDGDWALDHMKAFMWKRRFYEHERELRALILEPQEPRGLSVPVDLHKLVRAVYLSPQLPCSFITVVKNLLARFDLDVPVQISSLASAPDY